ncbi:SdpI family protein [Rhodococcus rhodnii]|uniref:SdpI family protein n=2 Tax=Rhodococcus rhodnii TaxID=38312 RepID=R7WSS4_9NOCA|nr:SdpI family protein [Rhodococcus rhodnii]EOM78316.1 hypothetical protein Rrhod_0313 [Rhodococcus rhodnii LMG 5362]
MELAGYLALLIAPTTLGLLSFVMYRAARVEAIPRNSMIGVRTSATLSSDRAWLIAHRVAAPYFAAIAVVGAAVVVVSAALPFAITAGDGRYPPAMALAPALGLLIQAVVLVAAAMTAHSAAKRS